MRNAISDTMDRAARELSSRVHEYRDADVSLDDEVVE